MSEATPTPEETTPVTLEQIRELVQEENKAAEAAREAALEEKLEALKAPKRDDVPEYVNRHGEKVTKLRNVSEARYQRLDEERAQFRDDESDHWAAEWIRGIATGDRAKAAQATDKLDAYYGRATTLEGTAPTTGALSDGTGAGLLPIPIAGLVMVERDNRSVGRRLFRQYPMMEQTRRITTVGAATSAMAAEGATAAQGEPTIATKVLIAKKLQCFFKASVEELADSAFDLVSLYAERAGSSIGEREDIQIATSNGTPPNIQESLSGTAYTEASVNVLQYEDLVGMFMGVGQAHRVGAVWLGDAAMLTFLGQMLDGNGRPTVLGADVAPQAVTDQGGVGMILNRPVFEFPIPAGELWFGNPMNAYAMGTHGGIVASTSEHVDFASDLVNFKFTERFDGVNLDAEAAQLVAGITSVA